MPAAMSELVDGVRRSALRLQGAPADEDAILERIGDARLVLIGEASHGTHDFYRLRAELTRRLIVQKGFHAVAAEADWPDAYRVNRYVRGESSDRTALDALADFARFPAWMWRNADVLEFVGWLRAHNETRSPALRAGFYGLDLYSLGASAQAVIAYLDRTEPEAGRRARHRYACFDQFGADTQAYGYAAGFGLAPSCEDAVVAQLREMRLQASAPLDDDEHFFAQQNARVVKDAEAYYRSMFRGRVSSWNLRDEHMMATLEALLAHLDRRARRSKIVVWAHNSHLGVARATELGEVGELNLGQLVRDRFGAEAVLIGLTTFEGTVTAASDWGGPAERKRVRPALPGSYESLFHETGLPRFLLWLDQAGPDLRERRLERAIGVIYLPRTERQSHYFHAELPAQFDAVVHLDQTSALEPLETMADWHRGEVPETFPSAM